MIAPIKITIVALLLLPQGDDFVLVYNTLREGKMCYTVCASDKVALDYDTSRKEKQMISKSVRILPAKEAENRVELGGAIKRQEGGGEFRPFVSLGQDASATLAASEIGGDGVVIDGPGWEVVIRNADFQNSSESEPIKRGNIVVYKNDNGDCVCKLAPQEQ